jgi:hypothetical protein
MVRTLEDYHKYLYGQEFHVRTDHSTFTRLMSFKNFEDKPPVQFSAYYSKISLPSTIKADILSK